MKSNYFVFPEEDNIEEVNSDETVLKLPELMTTGATKRTGKQFIFGLDLETFFELAAMEQKKNCIVSQGIQRDIASPKYLMIGLKLVGNRQKIPSSGYLKIML